MRRVKSVEEKLVAARQRYAQRTGRSVTAHAGSAPADNETIEFGTADGCPVRLPIAGLTRHLHCVGTTSAGKSNFLEIIIRQLISKGYGVCLLDPHGGHPDGLYRKTLQWLAQNGLGDAIASSGRLHIVDPNETSHVTGFNPLARPDERTSLSVVADGMLSAVERVWEDESSHAKPTIRRVLKGTFHALAELGLTLADTGKLFDDPHDVSGFRARVLQKLEDPYARSVLERIDRLGKEGRSTSEYDAEIIGPINRIAEFLSTDAIRLMVAQVRYRLDFQTILDDGHVVLANLQEGDQVSSSDTDLLGRMLLHATFFHCKRRKNVRRPYFVIVDECHRLLSGDVAHILSETRKYGLGLLLGHQYLAQIREAGDHVHHAICNNCATKAVFRIEDTEEATELANAVLPLDLELPIHALIRPAAVGQEVIKLRGKGYSKSAVESVTRAVAEALGHTSGTSSGSGRGAVQGEHSGEVVGSGEGWLAIGEVLTTSSGTSSVQSDIEMHSTMDAVTKSLATSIATGTANGHSLFGSVTESLATIYRDLPSAVHSKDNALYMAARSLRSLKTGSAFITHGPLANRVDVLRASSSTVSRQSADALRQKAFETSPASIPLQKASVQRQQCEHAMTAQESQSAGDGTELDEHGEPMSFREPAPKRKKPDQFEDAG